LLKVICLFVFFFKSLGYSKIPMDTSYFRSSLLIYLNLRPIIEWSIKLCCMQNKWINAIILIVTDIKKTFNLIYCGSATLAGNRPNVSQGEPNRAPASHRLVTYLASNQRKVSQPSLPEVCAVKTVASSQVTFTFHHRNHRESSIQYLVPPLLQTFQISITLTCQIFQILNW